MRMVRYVVDGVARSCPIREHGRDDWDIGTINAALRRSQHNKGHVCFAIYDILEDKLADNLSGVWQNRRFFMAYSLYCNIDCQMLLSIRGPGMVLEITMIIINNPSKTGKIRRNKLRVPRCRTCNLRWIRGCYIHARPVAAMLVPSPSGSGSSSPLRCSPLLPAL